jgi:hypothetical protein
MLQWKAIEVPEWLVKRWTGVGQVLQAIAREKEIEEWLRIKKIQLIVGVNPTWADLPRELFPDLEEEVQRELARTKNELAASDVDRSFGRKPRALQDDKG